MKAVSLREIKKELDTLSTQEIKDICLRLSRFKKENKELLTYLLFESHNEDDYVLSIKAYMDAEFEIINRVSFFYIRKSVRKILRNVKKFIRYSQNKETEATLLLYFCLKLKNFQPSISNSTQLQNTFERQLLLSKKVIGSLHEDLQYDFNVLVENLVE
ncbi:hypothetical protein [Cognatitamlana onchidii]|uniref:hypothetical protein n=1 Tax=Cognatitamlana onchidii TaxID=2562860 RepID=UPI0010A5EB4B|nr:hypothetical protein [Algibacter onchidii]